MSPEGALTIELDCAGSAVERVRIASSRPLYVTRALVGRTPEQCLQTVRLLFHVCGSAQVRASQNALRQAMGLAGDPRAERAGELLVLWETAREHAVRMLTDWPRFLGCPPAAAGLAELLRLERQVKDVLVHRGEPMGGEVDRLQELLEGNLFAGDMKGWSGLEDESQLQAWIAGNESLPAALLRLVYRQGWQAIGGNDIAPLAEFAEEEIPELLANDEFERAPHRFGRCRETGPLARQHGHPLLVDLRKRYRNGLLCRLAARVLELAGIPSRIRQLAAPPGGRTPPLAAGPWGIAQVQAARGLLIHGVRLKQGKVADYRIVAPTEWNFHPQGVVAESLLQLQSDDPDVLNRQAEQLINSIDPCVSYQIRISTRPRE